MIDLHQLRTFTLVAEKKSFSAAAEAMLLTQPTVSSHIRNLEEILGVVLFDRLPRRVELTGAGRILYRHSRELLALHRNALDAVREYSGRVGGDLLIGGSTIPGEYILPPLMGRFHRRAAEVEMTLQVSDSREICRRVLEGEVEVGMVGSPPEQEQLEAIPFCRDTLVAIMAPSHSLARARGGSIALKALLSEPMWLREPGSGTRAALAEALESRGKGLRDLSVIGQLGSTEAVKRAVMAGEGVGVVSALSVKEEAACGRLRTLRLAGLDADRSFLVIRHRQREPSPAGRLFHEFLLKMGSE